MSRRVDLLGRVIIRGRYREEWWLQEVDVSHLTDISCTDPESTRAGGRQTRGASHSVGSPVCIAVCVSGYDSNAYRHARIAAISWVTITNATACR